MSIPMRWLIDASERRRSNYIFLLVLAAPLIGLHSLCATILSSQFNGIQLLIGWIDEKRSATAGAQKVSRCKMRLFINRHVAQFWSVNGVNKGGTRRTTRSRSSKTEHSSSHQPNEYRSETSIKNRQLIFLNLFSSDLPLFSDFSSLFAFLQNMISSVTSSCGIVLHFIIFGGRVGKWCRLI